MIAVERNRITNYCRGTLYLSGYETECKLLKKKYNITFENLTARYRIKLIDYIIF